MNIFKKIFKCKSNTVVESYISNKLGLSKYYVGMDNRFVIRFQERFGIPEYYVVSSTIPSHIIDENGFPKFSPFTIVLRPTIEDMSRIRHTLNDLLIDSEPIDLMYELLDSEGKVYSFFLLKNCKIEEINESTLDYSSDSQHQFAITLSTEDMHFDK